jgi:hypothetical protein
MPLARALYVSRPALDSSASFDEMIASILSVSRARNERDGVTGSLLASQSCFIQTIEGDAAVVSATMGRIERDIRHHSLKRFEDEFIEERIFGEWSMFFGRIEQIDPIVVQVFSDTGTLDPFQMDRQQLLTSLCAGALFPVDRATTLRLDRIQRPIKAADLQHRLAQLAPGDTLVLSAAEIEEAFFYERTPEGCRAAATALAELYQCRFVVCEPDGSQVGFIRKGG